MARLFLFAILIVSAAFPQSFGVEGTAVWNGTELIVRLAPTAAKTKSQTFSVWLHLNPETPGAAYWLTWEIPYDPREPQNSSVGIYPPAGYKPAIVNVSLKGDWRVKSLTITGN
jgi:hypothetical protein